MSNRRIRRASILFALLFLACSTGELLSRAFAPNGAAILRTAFYARPAAYAHSAYFSAAFVDEQLAIRQRFIGEKAANSDQTGRYVNIKDSIRRTTGQPQHYDHTVWLFGSSTMFGWGVPDEYTIASQLQALIPVVRVVNMGAMGATTYHNLLWLKDSPVQAGDVVIFYGSSTDMLGVLFDATRQRDEHTACIGRYDTSQLVMLYRTACLNTVPLAPTDALVQEYHTRYLDNLQEAREYAQFIGATFISIQEPIGWANLRDDERNGLCEGLKLDYPGIDVVMPFAAARWHGGVDVDLSHVHDSRTEAELIDCAHGNEAANAEVARAIYERIAGR